MGITFDVSQVASKKTGDHLTQAKWADHIVIVES